MALPKIPVGPAPQTTLPHRLLTSIAEFDMPTARVDGVDTRWLAGISWNPLPCDRPLSVQPAANPCNPLASDNPDYGCEEAVSQSAFRVYDAFTSTNLQHSAEEIAAILVDRMPLMSSDAFARELISGGAGSDLSFSSEATAPQDATFGTTVTIEYGLAVLENELGRRLSGAQGLIHIPPGVLAVATLTYGLKPEGDHFVTPMGNKVIVDTGYIDAVAPSGATEAGDGEAWIYASGPVQYRSTDPRLLGTRGSEFIVPSKNDIERWMEMFGILKFDPCPVTAVTVGFDTTPV